MDYNRQVISYATSAEAGKTMALDFRQSTAGPELDIVHHFYESQLKEFQSETELSVFMEPRLSSGFPDMVVAFWDRDLADTWPDARRLLTKRDIIMLQELHASRFLDIQTLIKDLGPRKTDAMLSRFDAAGVADIIQNKVISKPLEQSFAIKRLIAIEAKVKDWRKGIEQTVRNTWFASESFLLLGKIPQSQALLDDAERLGVGVLHQKQSLDDPYIPSTVGRLPVSYVSWLFNEWVWKHELLKGN